MNEYPELAVDPAGRSYEELLASINPKTYYPAQLCPHCGRAYIDFEYLKKNPNLCPYCGVII